MDYVLAIDIGNTNITVGLCKGKKVLKRIKIPTHKYGAYGKGFARLFRGSGVRPQEVKDVVISSVVPLALSRLMAHLNKTIRYRISVIGRDIKVPVKNLYRVKREVGQDRLVNAFAAKKLYGTPAVVVDFGTAITFDIISRRGEYLGGLILPGIELSLAGLYQKTALLPKVRLKRATSIIGKDTVNSMRGGILFGFGAMCDGLVSRYKKMLGNDTKVIATGGNALLVKKYASSIQVVDEDLNLKGILLTAHITSCLKVRRKK